MSVYFQLVPKVHVPLIQRHSIFSSEGWTLGLFAKPRAEVMNRWVKARRDEELSMYAHPSRVDGACVAPPNPKATKASKTPATPSPSSKMHLPIEWEESYSMNSKSPTWRPGAKVFLKFGQQGHIQERIVVLIARTDSRNRVLFVLMRSAEEKGKKVCVEWFEGVLSLC
jgi:hypothetical protein